MSILYFKYLPIAIGFFLLFGIMILRYQKQYFGWIKKYWFYNQSFLNKVSTLFYLIFFGLMFFSLLDLRGPGEQIKANIKDQKTIIMIDSSASMLAEDVRPNRFKKSLILARHFIKRSAGHQIAIVLFSDIQRKLVPFTDDIDLLEAKLAGLEKTNISRGSSNISLAVQESIKYFEIEQGSKQDLIGNILLFTDSEEDDSIKLNIPKNISLGIVGVGTAKGAPIPVRSSQGIFQGYKKFNGTKVISKLNEQHIKKLGSYAETFKYWIAGSYTVPTEDILSFFQKNYQAKLSKGTRRIRPVLAYKIIIPAIVIFILSVLLKFKRSLVFMLPLLFLLTDHPAMAVNKKAPKADPKLVKEAYEQLGRLRSGKISREEKITLADNLLKLGKAKDAVSLYEETIKNKEDADVDTLMNWGVAYGKSKEKEKALEIFKSLQKRLQDEHDNERLAELRHNVKQLLKEDKQKGKQGKDQKDKKNKDKDKNQKDDKGQQGQSGDKKSKDKQNKGQDQKKDDKKEKNNDKKNKDKKDKSDKKDQDKKKEDNKNKDDRSVKDREEKIRKKRKMVKIPAMLKQIMDDDRKMQEKYMNTSTKDPENRELKDW